MTSPERTTGFLWLAWLVTWLALARWSSATERRQSAGGRLSHSVLVWVGSLLLFAHPPRFGTLLRRLLPVAPWISWAGVVLTVVGLGFSVWARLHLGRNWSVAPSIKAGHEVVRTGPYGITRHPIYTGLLLAFLGSALVWATVGSALGLVLATAGLAIKAGQEERLLLGHFGDAYRAYQREVPQLLPWPR